MKSQNIDLEKVKSRIEHTLKKIEKDTKHLRMSGNGKQTFSTRVSIYVSNLVDVIRTKINAV